MNDKDRIIYLESKLAEAASLVRETYILLDRIEEEWDSYVAFLKKKYPSENWQFTCEHHKRINALIHGDL